MRIINFPKIRDVYDLAREFGCSSDDLRKIISPELITDEGTVVVETEDISDTVKPAPPDVNGKKHGDNGDDMAKRFGGSKGDIVAKRFGGSKGDIVTLYRRMRIPKKNRKNSGRFRVVYMVLNPTLKLLQKNIATALKNT